MSSTETESPTALSDPFALLKPAILLIEDDARLGDMTRSLLARMYRVTWARTGSEALTALTRDQFDVVVADRRLPDMDGLDVVRALRRNGLSVPALMLTALASVDDIVDGLDGGANDYLVKPFHFAELEARVRSLTRGRSVQEVEIPIGDWMLRPNRQQIENPAGGSVNLTVSQVRLLGVLASSPQHIFARDELVRKVFSDHADSGVIDTYVSYIRRKTVRDMIITVHGRGYRIGEPAGE
ncbi:MAG: response regulator transcription factor [Bifidobacteriaceae bacterium]|jgi:DNA-binding response OmpR family regulator|nr:response regulator transcription factor [Bifidobacteriaceae bacterium]